MYTVSKGPSKIVHKTRRGLTQNLERLESTKEYTRKWVDSHCEPSSSEDWTIRMDRPVFHSNGKKSSLSRNQQEAISPQHEEIIKFIYQSWNSVCKECDDENGHQSEEDSGMDGSVNETNSSSSAIVYYKENEPNHHLQDLSTWSLGGARDYLILSPNPSLETLLQGKRRLNSELATCKNMRATLQEG